MGAFKALFITLMFFSVETALQSHRYRLNMIADVFLYETTHSTPAMTTVLGFCQGGRQALLRSLSDAGISALITDGNRTNNEMERIAGMDPGDEMVAGVQIPSGRGFPVSFLLDLSCVHANETLETAGKLGFFKSPYRWLLLQDASLGPDLANLDLNASKCDLSAIINLPVRADSHVTLACTSAHRKGHWSFQHLYRPGSQTPIVSQERGEWEDGQLSLLRHSNMLLRRDLMGHPVGAAFVIIDNSSLAHLTDGVDGHIDALSKALFANVYTVLELLNATPFALFTDTWGYTRKNGTWQNGMIGMLHQGKVDIGGTGSMFIANRYDAVQYIIYTIPIYGIFVFRAPPISYEYNLFGLPFSKSVWISSAVVLSLCCLFLFPVLRYERRKHYQENKQLGILVEKTEKSEQATLVDVLLAGFAAVCQQGATTHARGLPSRIITLWMHLCVICLYASYTASIVVLLQTSGTSISNLRDLWKSNIEAGAEDAPYNTFFFKYSTDEVRRGIYQNKMAGKSPTNNFFTLEEGIHLMRTKFFAFHAITNSIYYMIGSTWREDEKCGLIEFDNYLPSSQVALTVRKNSPYVEMFRVKFALIYESGHRDWLLRRRVYPKPKCPPNMVRFSSVSVVDVIAAIQIFGVGVLLSVLFLAVEIFIHCRKSNYRV